MSAGRLLLVEDEESLARLLSGYLERLGYQVDSCSTAAGALDAFAREAYELVIADLTLPDMPGDEMLDRMGLVNPRPRFLVMTGYPAAGRALPDGVGFLQKPFLPHRLAEVVAEMLRREA